jgi:hypothetical protein
MAGVREIEFNEALSHLQGLIGTELKIIINFYGTSCGCYLTGSLVRIDTLAPDDAAVNLVIGERNGVLLEVLLAGDLNDGGELSFHLPSQIAVQIESDKGT